MYSFLRFPTDNLHFFRASTSDKLCVHGKASLAQVFPLKDALFSFNVLHEGLKID